MKPSNLVLNVVVFALTGIITTSCSKGSKDSPVVLSAGDQLKITGKAYFTGKVLKADLYNGTDWTLSDVDVVATKKSGDQRRPTKSVARTGADARFRLSCARPEANLTVGDLTELDRVLRFERRPKLRYFQ